MTATVVTTREINFAQLVAEMGDAPLTLEDHGTERVVTSRDEAITQAQLEAAIEAHVPEPPPPTAASLLQAQVDELTDLFMMLMMGEL